MTKIQQTGPGTFQVEIEGEKKLLLAPVKTFGNFWGRIFYFLHLAGVSKIILEGNKIAFVSKKSFLSNLSNVSKINLKEKKISWRTITDQTLNHFFEEPIQPTPYESTFYESTLKALKTIPFRKKSAINANERLETWVKRNYRSEAIIFQNLEKAIEHFQLKEAQLIGIRGDGNCTFRALAVGLLILALDDGKEGVQALYTQIEKMKPSLNEENAISSQKQALLKNLSELANSQDLLAAFSEALSNENAPLLESFIAFLRAKASFFHIENWENYDEDKKIQLQGLHELDDPSEVLGHLKEKSCKDPKNGDPRFFGNPADLEALSALFKVQIASIKSEETYLQRDFSSTFVEYGQDGFTKKVTLLNLPGHTDLIVHNKDFANLP